MPRSVATKTKPAKAKRAAGPMTLDEFRDKSLEQYIQRARDGDGSQETVSQVRGIFCMVEQLGGVLTVADLQTDDFVRRFDEAIPGANINTRRMRLAMLHSILRRGQKLGWIASVPKFPDIIKVARLPRGERSLPPSAADVRRLMDHLASTFDPQASTVDAWKARRLYALVATIVLGGIRMRQALRLRVADVDLAGSTIWFRGGPMRRSATSTPVPVRISPELRAILAGWIRRTKCEWAFPGVKRMAPWREGGVGRDRASKDTPHFHLEVAAHAARVERITFESLARFHAENAVSSIALGGPAHATRQESATLPDPGSRPAVEIGEPGEPVMVRSKPKRRLTGVQYRAITALLEAWPGGLSMKSMDQACGGKAWRQTLIRLRTDPDWASAIGFAEKGFPGKDTDLYRIMPY